MKLLNRARPFLFPIIFSLVVSGLQANSNFQTLEKRLEQGNRPDTQLLESLPAPDSPHKFWLMGRVERDLKKANEYLKKAFQNGTKQRKVKYFKEWLRLALLRNPGNVDFELVNSFLEASPNNRYMDDEAWVLAGQLALSLNRPRKSEHYFGNVDENSPFHGQVLLFRAQIALEQGQNDRVESIFRRYLLALETKKHRPLYWITRGEYFEDTGADSEAYIAYSHVINHYPRSLQRFEAEERISELPLPEPLYSSSTPETRSTNKKRTSQSTKSVNNSGPFRIQVGSFHERDRATQLRQSLVAWLEYPVRVRRVSINSRPYFRVRVQDIPDRGTAVRVLGKLNDSGYDGFVVSPGDGK